jgi:hypothetical protein
MLRNYHQHWITAIAGFTWIQLIFSRKTIILAEDMPVAGIAKAAIQITLGAIFRTHRKHRNEIYNEK